jgi:hypothetical protein
MGEGAGAGKMHWPWCLFMVYNGYTVSSLLRKACTQHVSPFCGSSFPGDPQRGRGELLRRDLLPGE